MAVHFGGFATAGAAELRAMQDTDGIPETGAAEAGGEHEGATGRSVAEAATKQALLWISRSIESLAARVMALEAPAAVLALFESPEYFAHERRRYARLAEQATVLVGFGTDRGAPMDLPAGVHGIPLEASEPLAGEWVVLLASPLGCAGLVGMDLEDVTAASSLERGRLFRPDLSADPAWVADHAARIESLTGERMPAAPWRRLRDLADEAARAEVAPRERLLRETLTEQWWRTARVAVQSHVEAQLAYTDPLTGARNRRFLGRFLERPGPRTPSLAAVLFDIDGFKHLNDTLGHEVGDEVLQRFAAMVGQRTRDTDVLVRYGGDEWLLLLPGMSQEHAAQRAREIVAAFPHEALPDAARTLAATVSAGVGADAATDLDLAAIDAAMYRAKAAGGGRVSAVDEAEVGG